MHCIMLLNHQFLNLMQLFCDYIRDLDRRNAVINDQERKN